MDKLSGVPFEIKRVYQILGTKDGVARGFHAHKKLHQLAICVSGNCRMVLDDGEIREDVEMNSPSTGIGIPPMLWHEMCKFFSEFMYFFYTMSLLLCRIEPSLCDFMFLNFFV